MSPPVRELSLEALSCCIFSIASLKPVVIKSSNISAFSGSIVSGSIFISVTWYLPLIVIWIAPPPEVPVTSKAEMMEQVESRETSS